MQTEQEQEMDLERIQLEKENKKTEFYEEERRNKKELKQMEGSLTELQIKAEDLRKELKEKEQEQRISQYKLNEMKRSVKHNQLRPIKRGAASNGRDTNEPTSDTITVQNTTLNKQNLQQHNKIVSITSPRSYIY